MAIGDTTLRALMDASHYCPEIDPGTQFKVYDRVIGKLVDINQDKKALEDLLDSISAELMIALSENKE